MMSRTWNTSWPSRLKIFGCSVVLQTRCRMVVFPELARPMIRTRKRLVCIRRFCARLRCLSTSSAPWNSVLERDICGRDAWAGGSGEESSVAGGVLFGYAELTTGVTSLASSRSELVQLFVLPFVVQLHSPDSNVISNTHTRHWLLD